MVYNNHVLQLEQERQEMHESLTKTSSIKSETEERAELKEKWILIPEYFREQRMWKEISNGEDWLDDSKSGNVWKTNYKPKPYEALVQYERNIELLIALYKSYVKSGTF